MRMQRAQARGTQQQVQWRQQRTSDSMEMHRETLQNVKDYHEQALEQQAACSGGGARHTETAEWQRQGREQEQSRRQGTGRDWQGTRGDACTPQRLDVFHVFPVCMFKAAHQQELDKVRQQLLDNHEEALTDQQEQGDKTYRSERLRTMRACTPVD